MNLVKPVSYAGLILGILLVLAGFSFVILYFKDAVFLKVGESDQSLIFWYLPFLFAGLGSLICGFVIGQSSLHKLKEVSVLKHNGEYKA